jgi:protein SCO1/2
VRAQLAMLAFASTMFVGVAARGEPPASNDPKDEILAPPPTYKANGVDVVEKLGAKVPLDAKFKTQDGKATTLGEVLRGELPTILTFNYADCPMLCSLQLNGLVAALPGITTAGPAPVGAPEKQDKDMAFRIGTQFRIVSISLEPTESVERAAKMREKYIARLPEAQREAARAGWTFLVADGESRDVARVAAAVGFSYTYIEERAEWAHPAALIFLSTAGTVTRYVFGIEFDPQMMRESIFKAGLAEPTTAVGFMNRCYHFDPSASDHSREGMMALRVGAAGFLVLFGASFGFYFIRRQGRRRSSALASQANKAIS